MKRKQVIAGVMSVFLLGASIMPVYAEGDDSAEVEYTQDSTWTVSIPKTTLSQTQEVEQTVSATAMNIRPGQKLQVTIKTTDSDGKAILDEEGKVTLTRTDRQATTTSVVSTTANSRNPITSNTVIAEFENQSTDFVNDTTGKLYFSAVPEGTKAGDYTGSIVYVMKTVNKPAVDTD